MSSKPIVRSGIHPGAFGTGVVHLWFLATWFIGMLIWLFTAYAVLLPAELYVRYRLFESNGMSSSAAHGLVGLQDTIDREKDPARQAAMTLIVIALMQKIAESSPNAVEQMFGFSPWDELLDIARNPLGLRIFEARARGAFRGTNPFWYAWMFGILVTCKGLLVSLWYAVRFKRRVPEASPDKAKTEQLLARVSEYVPPTVNVLVLPPEEQVDAGVILHPLGVFLCLNSRMLHYSQGELTAVIDHELGHLSGNWHSSLEHLATSLPERSTNLRHHTGIGRSGPWSELYEPGLRIIEAFDRYLLCRLTGWFHERELEADREALRAGHGVDLARFLFWNSLAWTLAGSNDYLLCQRELEERPGVLIRWLRNIVPALLKQDSPTHPSLFARISGLIDGEVLRYALTLLDELEVNTDLRGQFVKLLLETRSAVMKAKGAVPAPRSATTHLGISPSYVRPAPGLTLRSEPTPPSANDPEGSSGSPSCS